MPEADILDRLLARLNALQASLQDDMAWMEAPPRDLADFETMASHRRSASRAVLKSFEQIEDQLTRAFRVIPRVLGEDSSRWFARDHADFMEKIGVIDDADLWSSIIKLRNELVHDYPLDPQMQFDRLSQAIGFLPELVATYARLRKFVSDTLPEQRI